MKKKTAADADQVAAYLLLNPDFLESHPQVFEALDVPHPTGGAVSLVERQVAVLRERNRAVTARLDAVIEAAHRQQYFAESLFARFRVLHQEGQWPAPHTLPQPTGVRHD